MLLILHAFWKQGKLLLACVWWISGRCRSLSQLFLVILNLCPSLFILHLNAILLQVLIGGGQNHRMGLFDMVMIKDNHISIAGGITNAMKTVDLYLEQNDLQMGVEVKYWLIGDSYSFFICKKFLYVTPICHESLHPCIVSCTTSRIKPLSI